ncbi:MAG: amidohydrolase [Acidobacteria bacterium]|nr:amidohydrolase [Acidobacteriota bacterium]
MRRAVVVLWTVVLAAALAAAQGPAGQGGRGRGVPIQPGEECPPGTTLVRVGQCQAPEFQPPSIVDYRPKSTLVVGEHPVPKAKFPVVDIHSHTGPTPQSIDQLIREMDALNIRVLNNLSGDFGSALKQRVDFIRTTKYADRFTVFANGLDGFRDVEAGYGRKAAAQLEEDVRNGAIGFKIFKETGMDTLKKDGARLKIGDPELAPLWDTAARLNIPVIIHTGEPQEFFHQPDMHNERWLELALFGSRRQYLNPKKVTFEQLVAERNDLFGTHPKTRFIAAHFGWHANDLGLAAKLLDEHPNVVLELAAILYDLGRQPRAAHDFFVKYQDRILFGKDTYAPTEYPYYWRVLETRDEYFDYYRDYHAFWNLYGMELPEVVLRKVYYQNALRVTPGLPRDGWPR